MSDRLSEIEGRLAAATTGPWEAVTDDDRRSKEHSVWSEDSSDYVAEWVATRPDADLIANAPADLAALVKFAREVKAAESRWRRRGSTDFQDDIRFRSKVLAARRALDAS